MDLLFDIGNSRIKWAARDGADWAGHGLVDRPEDVVEIGLDDVGRIAVAETGGNATAQKVADFCGERWPGARCLRAETGSRFGDLRNAYAEPRNMGVDRWLAMIAAWESGRDACCVMDVGTAVTVDVIADDGRHLGGWICPGLQLMRDALGRGTARVGHHPAETEQGWGDDTPHAVAAGTREALAGLIERAARQALDSVANPRFVVTGAGAGAAAAILKNLSIPVSIEPMLVFEGLRRWLEAKAR